MSDEAQFGAASTNFEVFMQEYLPLGRFNQREKDGLEALKSELSASIRKGVDFVSRGS